jgi:hypothetical protein
MWMGRSRAREGGCKVDSGFFMVAQSSEAHRPGTVGKVRTELADEWWQGLCLPEGQAAGGWGQRSGSSNTGWAVALGGPCISHTASSALHGPHAPQRDCCNPGRKL